MIDAKRSLGVSVVVVVATFKIGVKAVGLETGNVLQLVDEPVNPPMSNGGVKLPPRPLSSAYLWNPERYNGVLL